MVASSNTFVPINPLDWKKLVWKVVRDLRVSDTAAYTKEDAFQTGFVGLLDSISKYDPSKSRDPISYLYVGIRNHIMSDLRRLYGKRHGRKQFHFSSLTTEDDLEIRDMCDERTRIESALLLSGEDVFRAIRNVGLDTQDRVFIKLRFFDEKTFDQIMKQANVSKQTLHNRRTKILHRLRRHIEQT